MDFYSGIILKAMGITSSFYICNGS
ncbi:hypothetical protein [Candidatus Pantoea edessiphila]